MSAVTRQGESVMSADGVPVSVDFYRSGERRAALVVCPGFFKSKETGVFQRLSRALAEEWDVAAMDFRGHGRSGGWYTFSARESADLEAVLGRLQDRYDRIGLLGFSMGGAIAIHAAGRAPQKIRAIATISSPAAFEDVEFRFWTLRALRGGLEGLEPGAGFRPGNPFLRKPRAVDHLPALPPVPVLFVHGTRDAIVGVGHSRRLYAAAREPKRLEILENTGHAESLFRRDPDGFLRLVRDWFRAPLAADGT